MRYDRAMIERLAEQAIEEEPYPDPRFPPSLYYRFLRLLAAEIKPRVSVELGLCGGGGSLHLALGHPDGLVIGVDIVNSWPDNIAYMEQTLPNFRFWQTMDSVEAAVVYRKTRRRPVDILFIDSEHTYDRTMLEFYAWYRLLAAQSVVVLDDLYREGMRNVWQELPGQKIELSPLHDSYGFGVILL